MNNLLALIKSKLMVRADVYNPTDDAVPGHKGPIRQVGPDRLLRLAELGCGSDNQYSAELHKKFGLPEEWINGILAQNEFFNAVQP